MHLKLFLQFVIEFVVDSIGSVRSCINNYDSASRIYELPSVICTSSNYRVLAYESVYLPLYKVADTPFHIQGDVICEHVVLNVEKLSNANNEIPVTLCLSASFFLEIPLGGQLFSNLAG